MTGLCYAEYKAANLLWLLRIEISDFYDLQILCRVFTCKCKCCVFYCSWMLYRDWVTLVLCWASL